jgi:hypothetical protein
LALITLPGCSTIGAVTPCAAAGRMFGLMTIDMGFTGSGPAEAIQLS